MTAVGYAGGHTRNPSYEEVCSGLTGHAEAVLVVFDPADVGFADLLEISGSPMTPLRVCVKVTIWAVNTAQQFTV